MTKCKHLSQPSDHNRWDFRCPSCDLTYCETCGVPVSCHMCYRSRQVRCTPCFLISDDALHTCENCKYLVCNTHAIVSSGKTFCCEWCATGTPANHGEEGPVAERVTHVEGGVTYSYARHRAEPEEVDRWERSVWKGNEE